MISELIRSVTEKFVSSDVENSSEKLKVTYLVNHQVIDGYQLPVLCLAWKIFP